MSDNPNVGFATLSVIPVLSGAQAALESQVAGLGLAAKGEQAGQQFGSKFSAGASGGIGTVAKLMAGLGAVAFLKSAIDQTNTFNRGQARTANVLKDTKDASGETVGSIASLTDHLSQTDAVSKNVAQNTLNMVLGYTAVKNVGADKIFDRTAAAAIDMAAGLANSTGQTQDATTTARLLGAAMQDPVTGMSRLRREGVVLTSTQQAQIKTFAAMNDRLDEQKVLLGAVETKFKGAAAAMATPLDHAKVSVSNFALAVGQDAAPAVDALASSGSKAIGLFGEIPQPLRQSILLFGVAELVAAKFGDRLTAMGNNAVAAVKGLGKVNDEAQQLANAKVVVAQQGSQSASGVQAEAESSLATARARVTEAAQAEAEATAALEDAEIGDTAAVDRLAAAKAELVAASRDLIAATQTEAVAAARSAAADEALALAEKDAAVSGGLLVAAADGIAGALGAVNPLLAAAIGLMWAFTDSNSKGEKGIAGYRKQIGGAKTDSQALAIALAAHAKAQRDLNNSIHFADVGSHAANVADHLNKATAADIKANAQAILDTGNATEIAAAKANLLRAGIPLWQILATEATRTATSYAGVSWAEEKVMSAHRKLLSTQATTAQSTVQFGQSVEKLQDAFQKLQQDEATASGTSFDIFAMKAQAMNQAAADAQTLVQDQRQLEASDRGVASAEQGLADAMHSRSNAALGVQAAERGVADAMHQEGLAARSVSDAQQQLATDTANMTTLTNALTQARQDATRSLINEKIGEQGDQLSLTQAKENLAKAIAAQQAGPSNPDDPFGSQDLALAVAQARNQLAAATEKAKESRQDLSKADKAGVDGSPQVLSAEQALANGRVTLANDTRAIADAQYALVQQKQSVVDAQHQVTEAEWGLNAAQRQVSDAAYGIQTAQQAQGDAATQLASDTAKSAEDQIVSWFQIQAAEQTAAKAIYDDKLGVVGAWGAMANAALNYKINLQGVYDLANAITSQFPGLAGPLTGSGVPGIGAGGPITGPGAIPSFPTPSPGGNVVALPTSNPSAGANVYIEHFHSEAPNMTKALKELVTYQNGELRFG